MKKLLSILLAAMLLLSLAACGGKDDGDAADKLQGALGGVSEPASSAPTQADGTLLETEFWSVTYPEDCIQRRRRHGDKRRLLCLCYPAHSSRG